MQDILSNNLTIINPNNSNNLNPLIANPAKWSNILKAIREQFADELFECVWPFCGVVP